VAKAGVSVSDLEKVLTTLPPSVQAIYLIQTPYCHRTVHEALRFLEREKLITKSPNLHDMRRCLYQASPL
jgi:hypothetical protein